MRAGLRAAFIENTQRNAGPQYHAQPAVEGAGLRFVHSQQQWQARLDESGLSLKPTSGAWLLTMALQPTVCGGGMEATQPQPAKNEVSYKRGSVKEWYLNGPLGLEQGFTVSENPCPGEPLRIDVALGGDLKAQQASGGLVLRDASGKTALRYTDLYSKDATGRRVKSQLSLDESGRHLAIVVNDDDAKYPVTIDPLLWMETQRLTATDKQPSEFFGYRMAMHGSTAVIATPLADTAAGADAGAAYVYGYTGGLWSELQKLVPDDAQATDYFGYSVAMSADTVVVGAVHQSGTMPGAAYIFTHDGTSWVQAQKVAADDPMPNDLFGGAVAVEGDLMVVTAPFSDQGEAQESGSAYVFHRNAGNTWDFQARLLADTPKRLNRFGSGAAISGNTLAIVEPGWDDMTGTTSGNAYLYVYDGSNFVLQQKVSSPSPGEADAFANSVAIDGNDLLIGAPAATVGELQAGAAYHYTRIDTTWVMQQQLAATEPVQSGYCGYAVALAGELAIVGCPLTPVNGVPNAGITLAFHRMGASSFGTPVVLSPSMPDPTGVMGASLALSEGRLFSGAFQSSPDGVQYAGVVHVFQATQNEGAPCAVNEECSSGYCVDGVCCNEACGGNTQGDCQACAAAVGASADGTCTMIPSSANFVCRKAGGPCDVEDKCDGTSVSCADAKVANGTLCRTATGICDASDTCDGVTDNCIDTKKTGVVCRVSGGPCDMVERCDGTNNICPEDVLAGNNVQCKAAGANQICDPADFCNGKSKLCPAKFATNGTQCGPGMLCNGTGLCR